MNIGTPYIGDKYRWTGGFKLITSLAILRLHFHKFAKTLKPFVGCIFELQWILFNPFLVRNLVEISIQSMKINALFSNLTKKTRHFRSFLFSLQFTEYCCVSDKPLNKLKKLD